MIGFFAFLLFTIVFLLNGMTDGWWDHCKLNLSVSGSAQSPQGFFKTTIPAVTGFKKAFHGYALAKMIFLVLTVR